MSAPATPTNKALPATGAQVAWVLHNQDGDTSASNDGQPAPGVVPVSANSSTAIEPSYAPIYPQGTVAHRAGNTAASSDLSSQDTTDNAHDPTAVPTWVGYVSNVDGNSNSGQTHLYVTPYANWGAPPSGANLYVDTGANWENLTGSGAATGGTGGHDYTITCTGNLAHTHATGARVIVMASGGLNTSTASSVPSGPVGGPGTNWIDFDAVLTGPTGAGATSATANVAIRKWSSRRAKWVSTGVTFALGCAASATDNEMTRVETHGFWYYAQVTGLTGTGGTTNSTIGIEATIG